MPFSGEILATPYKLVIMLAHLGHEPSLLYRARHHSASSLHQNRSLIVFDTSKRCADLSQTQNWIRFAAESKGRLMLYFTVAKPRGPRTVSLHQVQLISALTNESTVTILVTDNKTVRVLL